MTILLTPADFKKKDNKAFEWSKISTLIFILAADKTKQAIDLTSPEGSSLLKRIDLAA
jgi:hypothetical protein